MLSSIARSWAAAGAQWLGRADRFAVERVHTAIVRYAGPMIGKGRAGLLWREGVGLSWGGGALCPTGLRTGDLARADIPTVVSHALCFPMSQWLDAPSLRAV